MVNGILCGYCGFPCHQCLVISCFILVDPVLLLTSIGFTVSVLHLVFVANCLTCRSFSNYSLCIYTACFPLFFAVCLLSFHVLLFFLVSLSGSK